MGKVKDGTQPAANLKPSKSGKAAKPGKGGPGAEPRKRRVAQFLATLVRADLYKPKQGYYARLYTGLALAVVLALGLWRLHDTLMSSTIGTRFGVPSVLGAVLGWTIFRLVQYPPFVEFLIATEAEMNKVSWTSRDDLYRATTVVLTTVVLMSVFLFGVDWVWMQLLQFLGVLKFGGGGGFGSTA